MNRRAFLARATALGLSLSATPAILAACGGQTNGSAARGTPEPTTRTGARLPEIVPWPVAVQYGEMVAVDGLVCLACPPGTLRDRLEEVAGEAGVPLRFGSPGDADGLASAHLVVSTGATDLPAQGYRLAIVRGDGGLDVEIPAHDDAGAFYGMCSLRQLVVVDGGIHVRVARVEDHPGFERRGVILTADPLDRVRFGVGYKPSGSAASR